jgi:heme oxygenase
MPTIETSPASLPDRLRQATQTLHVTLEAGLGLLTPPIDRDRILILLERFHGFHAAWEPAAALLADEDFLAPRRRAALAAADLALLGRTQAEIAALPLCAEAARFANGGEAWGSLYVMEGSTLGGKLIGRRLAGEDWFPPGGLRYFDPHGERTGAMWRETRERLADLSGTAHEQAVIDGARATFQRLHDWLRPAFRG